MPYRPDRRQRPDRWRRLRGRHRRLGLGTAGEGPRAHEFLAAYGPVELHRVHLQYALLRRAVGDLAARVELTRRPVEVNVDKQLILDLEVLGGQASGNPAQRAVPTDVYCAHWFATTQREEFWSALEASLADRRTIADVWLDRTSAIGWTWVTFVDVADYDVVVAELREIAVVPDAHGRGTGTAMLSAVIADAAEKGATFVPLGGGDRQHGVARPARQRRVTSGSSRLLLELSTSRQDLNDAWLQESADTLGSLAGRLRARALREGRPDTLPSLPREHWDTPP